VVLSTKYAYALSLTLPAAALTAVAATAAFVDKEKCAQGFDEIAEGTLNSTKTRESHMTSTAQQP
jgi:hypothetical protein